jgi:hypothetical protein
LGINCWYDEHNILPGDLILEAVDRGIKSWDKLIFVASKNSLSAQTGWWVEQELERAFRKERENRKENDFRESMVIPLAIDNELFKQYEGPYKASLLNRRVADFRNWQNPSTYTLALETLIKSLGTR